MSQYRLGWKILVLATWALFVAGAALFYREHIFPISKIVDTVGVLGFLVALVWFVSSARWKRLFIAVSAVFIVLYVVRWVLIVDYIQSGSPDNGVASAIMKLLQLWISEFERNADNSRIATAFLKAYWDAIAAFVQILTIPVILIASRPAAIGELKA
jgi:hypothetical protein